MYSIQIVGAGYVGTEIARFFKAKGQKVSAIMRTETRRPVFEKEGILPLVADLTRIETLEKIPPAHFIVLCPAPSEHDELSYRRIYLEGIRNFLDSQRRRPSPYLIVYLSSTSVWRQCSGGWVDESVAADPDNAKSRILLEAEDELLHSGFPVVIFRLAGIYGPGRNRLSAFREGPGRSVCRDYYMNRIHRDDIVRAVSVLFKKAKEGSVYTGVDDQPVLYSEFSCWLGSRLGIPNPGLKLEQAVPPDGKRCRNRRLKELGFQFQYPTYREGYEALIREEVNGVPSQAGGKRTNTE